MLQTSGDPFLVLVRFIHVHWKKRLWSKLVGCRFSVSAIYFPQRRQNNSPSFSKWFETIYLRLWKTILKYTPDRRGGTDYKESCRASRAKKWDFYVISLGSLPLFMRTSVRLLNGSCNHIQAASCQNRSSLTLSWRHLAWKVDPQRWFATPVHIITSWTLSHFLFSSSPHRPPTPPYPHRLDFQVVSYAACDVWSENIKIPMTECLHPTSPFLIYLLCLLLVWKTCSEIQKNKRERKICLCIWRSI